MCKGDGWCSHITANVVHHINFFVFEVEKGVHLLEEISGMYSQYRTTYLWPPIFFPQA